MAYVFVGQVGDSCDGAFLYGPFPLVAVVGAQCSYLESACLVFADDNRLVYLYLFYLKGTAYDIYVMVEVVLQVGVFFG